MGLRRQGTTPKGPHKIYSRKTPAMAYTLLEQCELTRQSISSYVDRRPSMDRCTLTLKLKIMRPHGVFSEQDNILLVRLIFWSTPRRWHHRCRVSCSCILLFTWRGELGNTPHVQIIIWAVILGSFMYYMTIKTIIGHH